MPKVTIKMDDGGKKAVADPRDAHLSLKCDDRVYWVNETNKEQTIKFVGDDEPWPFDPPERDIVVKANGGKTDIYKPRKDVLGPNPSPDAKKRCKYKFNQTGELVVEP